MLNFLRRIKQTIERGAGLWEGTGRVSFAQCGEDLILSHVFSCLGLERIFYVDIGAHHPALLSNTYYFYLRGSRGVLVEPNPSLVPLIRRTRPGDLCLNVGIGPVAETAAPYYVMSSPALNTFSRVEAERYVGYGTVTLVETLQVPLLTVPDLLKRHCKSRPNLLSLDVEGHEAEILSGYDFDAFRPEVVCVESLSYAEDKTEKKTAELESILKDRGYFVYADTYINTLFVDRASWEARP